MEIKKIGGDNPYSNPANQPKNPDRRKVIKYIVIGGITVAVSGGLVKFLLNETTKPSNLPQIYSYDLWYDAGINEYGHGININKFAIKSIDETKSTKKGTIRIVPDNDNKNSFEETTDIEATDYSTLEANGNLPGSYESSKLEAIFKNKYGESKLEVILNVDWLTENEFFTTAYEYTKLMRKEELLYILDNLGGGSTIGDGNVEASYYVSHVFKINNKQIISSNQEYNGGGLAGSNYDMAVVMGTFKTDSAGRLDITKKLKITTNEETPEELAEIKRVASFPLEVKKLLEF